MVHLPFNLDLLTLDFYVSWTYECSQISVALDTFVWFPIVWGKRGLLYFDFSPWQFNSMKRKPTLFISKPTM